MWIKWGEDVNSNSLKRKIAGNVFMNSLICYSRSTKKKCHRKSNLQIVILLGISIVRIDVIVCCQIIIERVNH